MTCLRRTQRVLAPQLLQSQPTPAQPKPSADDGLVMKKTLEDTEEWKKPNAGNWAFTLTFHLDSLLCSGTYVVGGRSPTLVGVPLSSAAACFRLAAVGGAGGRGGDKQPNAGNSCLLS